MKYVFLIFCALIGTFIIVGSLFQGQKDSYSSVSRKVISVFSDPGIFQIDSKGETSGVRSDTQYLVQFLRPSHWIYYRRDGQVQYSSGSIQIGEGGGLLSAHYSRINKVKYFIKNARVEVIRPGLFSLEQNANEIIIYPISAILEVTLLDNTGKDVTNFTLFPFIRAKIDTTTISGLKNADLMRISTLNSFSYDPISLADGGSKLFQGKNLKTFSGRILKHLEQKISQLTVDRGNLLTLTPDASGKEKLSDMFPQFILNPKRNNEKKQNIFIEESIRLLQGVDSSFVYNLQELTENQRDILDFFFVVDQVGRIRDESTSFRSIQLGKITQGFLGNEGLIILEKFSSLFDIFFYTQGNYKEFTRAVSSIINSQQSYYITGGKYSGPTSLFLSLLLSSPVESDFGAKNSLFELYSLISKTNYAELKTEKSKIAMLTNTFYNYFIIMQALNRELIASYFQVDTQGAYRLLPSINPQSLESISTVWGRHLRLIDDQFRMNRIDYVRFLSSSERSQSDASSLLEGEIAIGKELFRLMQVDETLPETAPVIVPSPQEIQSNEIDIFITNELINGRFASLNSLFPILKENISAQKGDDGSYTINLSDVTNQFAGGELICKSNYIYQRDAFFQFFCTYKRPEGLQLNITFFPSRIQSTLIKENLENLQSILPGYIAGKSGSLQVTFDTVSKSLQ